MKVIGVSISCMAKDMIEELENPAEVGIAKGSGMLGDLAYTVKGDPSVVYSLTCMLVAEVIGKLQPGNKGYQKEVLDMLHGSVADQLGLVTE